MQGRGRPTTRAGAIALNWRIPCCSNFVYGLAQTRLSWRSSVASRLAMMLRTAESDWVFSGSRHVEDASYSNEPPMTLLRIASWRCRWCTSEVRLDVDALGALAARSGKARAPENAVFQLCAQPTSDLHPSSLPAMTHQIHLF